MTIPNLNYRQSFGTEPFESIHGVVESNNVMHGCLRQTASTWHKRSATGGRVLRVRKSCHQLSPAGQFACVHRLVEGARGMLMHFQGSSVIRVGGSTRAGSMWIIVNYLRLIGEIWPTGITAPNSVVTMYFDKVIKPSMTKSPCYVRCESFVGKRIIVNTDWGKHTVSIHLGWCEATKRQKRSNCTIPGIRHGKELRAVINGVIDIVKQHYAFS